jgi:predicted metalloprotease with PDZ domain
VPLLQLDLRDANQHLVGVCVSHTPVHPTLRLSLPAWTPGSYLIRDYVRQLEGLRVSQQGIPLELRRTSPSSWQVELQNLEPLEIHYQVVATELSVRTCHLTADHGFLALAAVAVQIEGERWHPHGLQLQLPEGWKPFVPLPEMGIGSKEADGWIAADFDQLIDTPIEVGPHGAHSFSVAGVPHRWVTWGETLAGQDFITADPHWLTDVERVCQACCALMGVNQPAADQYLFVLHLSENGYGGLEHDSSTVLHYGRKALAKADGRRKLLQLVAHEYLHQWNVRRLRPAELTPYCYGDPVVTPTLWFAEGITSYVDQLLPFAAGVTTAESVLEDLGADLSRYLLSPGRAVQSLLESSQEAWVKLYKADAYSSNSQISYYLKGAVVALVVDLILRRHGASLTQVLHNLWQSHGRWGKGYHESDLVEALAEFHAPLSTLLPQWLRSKQDPPLPELLADVGLELTPETETHLDLGAGVELKGGQLWVQRVNRHGPASQAGLMVGDELVALDAERLRHPEDLDALLNLKRSGQLCQLLVARDGLIRCLTITPATPSIKAWTLGLVADQTEQTTAQRNRWLSLQPA